MKASRNHDKIKILIVDDSALNRRNMTDILTHEGFNVVGAAANAEEGMQLVHTTKANVIFIDIVMPEISGLEFAKVLQDKVAGEKFLIMMSSLTIESVIIESISNGATDFLQKPFEKEDLLRCMEKVEKIFEKENR